ncbi:MAG: LytTR family DNA-binding domain-containing protein [Casimicrobiaceae bacterium]
MPARNPTALIAEDERVLRDELRERLGALWPELVVVAEAADGDAALRAIEHHRPDVLFLDIEMPGLSGLDVARRANGRCHVVFVTAYDAFAVAAFEQGAVDYVMKPVTAERLAIAVERVRQRQAAAPVNLDAVLDRMVTRLAGPKPYLRWINASLGEEQQLITVDEVTYFRSDVKYTRVVTADREWLIRKPVRELCMELDPQRFWQVHRSVIVNLSEIASIRRDFRGHIHLRLKERGEELPVSQPYAHLFRQM